MMSFLKKILVENGFSIDEFCFNEESVFQADRLGDSAFDLLTVCFINQDQIFEDKLTEKMQEFRSVLADKKSSIIGLDKNLSLLIMLKVTSLDYPSKIQSLIFDIEEDPYIFKKYVLTYTEEQKNLLLSLFKESGKDAVTPYLNNILYDTEKFSAFKNREKTENALLYDIVSKIFIKLPCLGIENQHKDMDMLLNDILKSIDDGDKSIWESIMNLREHYVNDPSIEKILEALGVESIE